MQSLALFRLDHRIAVVTGGSSGIGRAMAYAMGAKAPGWCSLRVARMRWSAVRKFAAEGIAAKAVAADWRRGGADRAIDAINAAFGAPDIPGQRRRQQHPQAAAGAQRRRHPRHPRAQSRSAVGADPPPTPAMQAKGWGRIVNASQQSFRVQQQRRLRHQQGRHRIADALDCRALRPRRHHLQRALAPGFVVTPLTRRAVNSVPGFAERRRGSHHAQPATACRQFHGAAIFLASDASAFVTGHRCSSTAAVAQSATSGSVFRRRHDAENGHSSSVWRTIIFRQSVIRYGKKLGFTQSRLYGGFCGAEPNKSGQ